MLARNTIAPTGAERLECGVFTAAFARTMHHRTNEKPFPLESHRSAGLDATPRFGPAATAYIQDASNYFGRVLAGQVAAAHRAALRFATQSKIFPPAPLPLCAFALNKNSSFIIFKMPLSVDIQFADDNRDALDALKGVLSEREINEFVAQAEIDLFRINLLANGTNKRGWPSTAFWERAAKSLSWSEELGGVSINIAQVGVRQRYQGGGINPTSGHVHLSIPARAEAYGHVPGDFTNLRLAFHHVGGRAQAFALVEADGAQAKPIRHRVGDEMTSLKSNRSHKNDGASSRRLLPEKDTLGGGVYFWLVDSVYQDPDPDVIPDNREIAATAKDALEDLVKKFSHRWTQINTDGGKRGAGLVLMLTDTRRRSKVCPLLGERKQVREVFQLTILKWPRLA